MPDLADIKTSNKA